MKNTKTIKRNPLTLSESQHLTTRWLRKAGLDEFILAEPHPELDPAFCQVRARRLRQAQMIRALFRLHAARTKGTRLYAVHLLNSRWHANCPMPEGGAYEVQNFLEERLGDLAGLQHLEGCIEFDYCTGLNQPGQWRRSFHGIAAIEPGLNGKQVLQEALRSPSELGMRCPIRIEPVTYLWGALRYAYKGLLIDAVTERVSYRGKRADGSPRTRSRSVRLKPPQQIELIQSLAKTDLEARCLVVSPKRRVPRQHC